MSDTERNWAWLTMAIISVIALLMFLSVIIWPAHAFDSGQYEGVDPKIRDWFKGVRKNGVPCCDVSDGHLTTWERKSGDEHYWVPIDGELRQVPTEAVVTDTSHPEGESVVWYVRQSQLPLYGGPPTIHIRCFTPGRGV